MAKVFAFLLGASFLLSSCGEDSSQPESEKTQCSSDAEHFTLCLNFTESFNNPALKEELQHSTRILNDTIDKDSFREFLVSQTPWTTSYTSRVYTDLKGVNYEATIESYCDAESKAWAKAELGGSIISINECRVKRYDSKKKSISVISGLLAHEVMHNLSYSHGDDQPDPRSVPYFIGDLVEAYLQ